LYINLVFQNKKFHASDAHAHVQRLVKMETVLEESTTEEHRSIVCFLWAKGLNAKDFHIEMFPVYGGKSLSRKVVQNWVEKFSQGRSKVADDVRPGRPVEIVTEATVQQVEELI
jgi:transposase